MLLGTIIKLLDVHGTPSVRLDLPATLRTGDRFTVQFRLTRKNAGRTEMLDVTGDLRVVSTCLDATEPVLKQLLGVESAQGIPFKWRAVKTRPAWHRVLTPAKYVRTPLGSK